jgi:hypothetical protein
MHAGRKTQRTQIWNTVCTHTLRLPAFRLNERGRGSPTCGTVFIALGRDLLTTITRGSAPSTCAAIVLQLSAAARNPAMPCWRRGGQSNSTSLQLALLCRSAEALVGAFADRNLYTKHPASVAIHEPRLRQTPAPERQNHRVSGLLQISTRDSPSEAQDVLSVRIDKVALCRGRHPIRQRDAVRRRQSCRGFDAANAMLFTQIEDVNLSRRTLRGKL